jgi:hypothetical protein
MEREDLVEPASWEQGSIAFTVQTLDAGLDVWSFDMDARQAKPLLASEANESEPVRSAGVLAYVSDATGREEVYVIPAGASDGALRISSEGGRAPRWSPDGKTLFFRRGEDLFAVTVGRETEMVIGPPSLVWSMAVDTPYEIMPGGGFLVAEKPAPAYEIVVVTDFTAELPTN